MICDDANARFNQFLCEIDKLFKDNMTKLSCTFYCVDSDALNNNTFRIIACFDTKKNLKTKIRFISKLSYSKLFLYKEDTIVFNFMLPKHGSFDFKQLDGHDSSIDAWSFYRCKYMHHLSKDFLTIKQKQIKVHGEVDFNFSLNRIESFNYIIDNDANKPENNDKKALAKDLLSICSEYNYSLLNFSLMPSVGNLQATKGSIGNDRFDVFIWALDQYYSKSSDLIVNSHTTVQSQKELVSTLNCFDSNADSFYSYYRYIYDLDENLVKEIIESGKKKIDNTDRVLDYIVLAFKVWQKRNNIIDHNQCKDLFYKLGGKKVIFSFMPYIEKLNKMGYKIDTNI